MKGSIKTKLDEKAYTRDGFRCVECNKATGIEAHHIIPELEELDNLVTLCHGCHKKRHNMAGCFKKGHKICAKLKTGEVWLIKKIINSGIFITNISISKMFNVNRRTIYDIANKKTWVGL